MTHQARIFITLAALLMLSSCVKEYDFSKSNTQLGTLGEEAHKIMLKDAPRAVHKGAEKEALLIEKRQQFINSVDTIAPQQQLALLDVFLQQTLKLIDSGLMPGMTRKTSKMLRTASQDQQLLQNISSAFQPQPADFISPISAPDLIGYVTTYPNLQDLGIKGTRIVLDNDGFTDDGAPSLDESNGVTELLRTLSGALQDISPEQVGDPLAIIVRDILLKEDPRFEPLDSTRPLYVAVYDSRGLPQINPELTQDLFADVDNDGLPDVDTNNNFILKNGGFIPKEAFADMDGVTRDGFGRTMINGEFAFEYIDLNLTALGYLIREYAKLSEQGVAADLLATFRHIMGPTTVNTDERGPFEGFRQDNPLMDLTWGASRALSYPHLPELASETATFMEKGSSELAGVVVALDYGVEVSKAFPDAKLEPTQTLLNDLIPTLNAIASDKELWHDFMNALGDPITPRVGDAMGTLLSYKNTKATVTPGGPYDSCFQQCKLTYTIGTNDRFECVRACPSGEIFKIPMDYSAPETPENRSQLQATWHLMWSLAGVPYDMEMDEVRIGSSTPPAPPALISLPGGAEAFLRSVAGNLDLEQAVPREILEGNDLGPILNALGISNGNIAGFVEMLSELFGVTLSKKPTPDQLTRMFTQEDISYREGSGSDAVIIDIREPRDAEGYKLADNLADGLFEAEASGLIDAVYPMAKAFSDHDKEHLMLELFEVVHKHYPQHPEVYVQANGLMSPSQAANLRSFEPIMLEVFADGRLMKSLYNLSRRLQTLKQSTGLDLNEQLRLFIVHATTPGNFTTRDGLDYINLPDGRTQRNLSPLHVMTHSLTKITQAVTSDPEAKEQFSRAFGALVDLVLGAEWPAGENPRFKSDASIALGASVLNFAADFTAEKRDDNTLNSWLQDDIYHMLEDLWTSRLLAGLVLIAEQILEEPENRAAIDDFIAYLVGTPVGREHTTVMGYQLLIRSVNTDVWLPIAQNLSRLIDPDREWNVSGQYAQMHFASMGALMLHNIMLNDTDGTGIALMNRALLKAQNDKAPLFTLLDFFAQYLRLDPSSSAPLAPADYEFILTQIADWLDDDAKGMEQMYDLVDLRAN